MQEDLDTLRNGNAVEEADSNPEFRGRVERAVVKVVQEMRRITRDTMDVE